MVGPRDIQHVIAKSYFAEKVMDVENRLADQRYTDNTRLYLRQETENTKQVQHAAPGENTIIDEHQAERRKQRRLRYLEKLRKRASKEEESPVESDHIIDIKA